LKLPLVVVNYVGKPEIYFYGVAKIICLEWKRKRRSVELDAMGEDVPEAALHAMGKSVPEVEAHHACLEECLSQLGESSRELVLEYYQQDKRAKIDHRLALANSLGIAVNALRIRAHRIRQVLEKCVLQCVNKTASLRYQ
jgi:DNA-directed RNA polymerase specialized sigma24 family protein